MEGFDFKNSAIETQFRRSPYYADYGVGRISKPDNSQQQESSKTTYNNTQTPTPNGTYYNQAQLKAFVSKDDLKDAFDRKFIDKTVKNYNESVIDTITDDDDDKKHKLRKAFIVGTSTLLFGGVSLLLTKGKLSSKAYKYVDRLTTGITKKISEIKEKPEMSKVERLYLSGLQVADKAFSRAQGTLFNISPIKDVLFEKVVREKLGLGKACDAITNGFRKASFGTVKSMYKTASKNVNSMTGSFVQMNERIASGEFGAVGKDVTEALDGGVKKINSLFNDSFTEPKIVERSDSLVKKFKGLGGRVYNAVYGDLKGFIKDSDKWSIFISEKMVAGDKAKIVDDLASRRRVISNTPKDVYDGIAEGVLRLEKAINPNDKGSIDVLKELRGQADRYINPVNSQSRGEIINDMRKTVAQYSAGLKDGAETSAQKKILSQLDKVLQNDQKGAVEEMLTQYKKILPEAEYNELKKTAQKATRSLGKAVYNEGNNYTDKVRDLSVGSALTDVAIGTAVPVIATGVAISAADTKEKKRSVLLKYGIPLMVGLATTTTCALKLISGGKSLIFGTFTSTLTNNICERIDKKLKSKNAAVENTPAGNAQTASSNENGKTEKA